MMVRPSNEPADEDGLLRGACAANGEERVVESHDFCDGAVMAVPYRTKTITECTKTDSLISSDSSLARTQRINIQIYQRLIPVADPGEEQNI